MTCEKELDILLQGYETARAWSGLIISLSTGSIVFTATFKDKFVSTGQSIQWNSVLLVSWIGFAVAIFAGLAYIASLVPHLSRGCKEDLNLYAGYPIIYATAMWISFFIAIIIFGTFICKNLF